MARRKHNKLKMDIKLTVEYTGKYKHCNHHKSQNQFFWLEHSKLKDKSFQRNIYNSFYFVILNPLQTCALTAWSTVLIQSAKLHTTFILQSTPHLLWFICFFIDSSNGRTDHLTQYSHSSVSRNTTIDFCTPLFNSYDQKNLTKIVLLYGVANNIFAYFLIFEYLRQRQSKIIQKCFEKRLIWFIKIFPKSSSEALPKTSALRYFRERWCTQDKVGEEHKTVCFL